MRIPKKRGSAIALALAKRKFSLLLMVSILCLMTVPLASAHLEPPITSPYTYNIPTIDGVISSGEWTDATILDFTLHMRLRAFNYLFEDLSARFYVKNDENNIYAAVQIFNEDYDTRDIGDYYDGFGLLFEDNHDGVLSDGDNGEGCRTWSGSPFYSNNDLYYNSSASWLADAASPPYGADKTNDGAFAWTHTNPTEQQNGTYTFEMRIPLVGSDGDAYDLVITSLPRTIGFKIWFFEMEVGTDGVYPDDPTIWRNSDETEDGSKFGDLVLSPKPIAPAVGGMAAPIVVPINKLNLLTPLIWLASAILFPIAATVVFVKLKKKK